MACSDLTEELKKDGFSMDSNSEAKIVEAVLGLLSDTSGDVQGVAVKALGPLVKKISDSNVTTIISQLTTTLYNSKKANLREISNLGLKSVIQDIDDTLGQKVAALLGPKLAQGVVDSDAQVVQESLDILCDLLSRFGGNVPDTPKLQSNVLPQLSSARQVTKKRAASCLTHIAKHAPDSQYNELVEQLIDGLRKSNSSSKRTFIQTLGSLARYTGHRLGKHVSKISPLLLSAINDGDEEGDEDIKENALAAFESFVLRCPKDVEPELPKIIKVAQKYIGFDPNYAGSDDDDEAGDEDWDDEDEDSYESDEDEDDLDDDDESWKVRRASCRALSAVIVGHPAQLPAIWSEVAPALIKRFSEREEGVRLDVFTTFNDLVRQTANYPTNDAALRAVVPDVLKQVTKRLDARSVKTRHGAIGVLREIATHVPGAYDEQIAPIIPGLLAALSDKPSKNLQLKIEALTLVRVMIGSTAPATFAPHLDELVEPVVAACSDQYFKVVSEALRVCTAMVGACAGASRTDFIQRVYRAVLPQFNALDIDQAVKSAAIEATALIVKTIGADTPDLNSTLATFANRLGNEITRNAAVVALGEIAEAKIDISSILGEVVVSLASFLRKANRQLKTNSIIALDKLVSSYGTEQAFKGHHNVVIEELSKLVVESDLHLSHLALALASRVIHAESSVVPVVKSNLYPKMLQLLSSSVLQGAALDSLTDVYETLVTTNNEALNYETLIADLNAAGADASLSKQNYLSLGRCVSSLVLHGPAAEARSSIKSYFSDIQTEGGSVQNTLLALHCVGDIGRLKDLKDESGLLEAILSLFENESEEVRAAASYALGAVAVGNLTHFLPFILKDASQKHSYLLMHSVREIIIDAKLDEIAPHFDAIVPLLLEHTKSQDEGTRNVVSECLGKLARINPSLIGELVKLCSDPEAPTRAAIVAALRFAITDNPSKQLADALAGAVNPILDMLKDSDVSVRRATLLTLNYAIHNQSGLVQDSLPSYLPFLYSQTEVKEELIHTVDLGPFKHKVDEGLDARKSAFECMYTILERIPNVLDVSEFVKPLASGLDDDNDIKLQCYLIIVRLAGVSGAHLLEVLDSFVAPLQKELRKKIDTSAIAQAQERQLELKRSALRAVAALNAIANAETNSKLQELVATILAGPQKEEYDAILKQKSD